jgi:sulfide:quinone oxidoreductase
MNSKTVLILGGGIGGLVAANVLKNKLGNLATVRIIERKRQFQFPPSYLWLMVGTRQKEQVQKDLDELSKKGIDVVNDDILSMDLQRKVVKTTRNEFPYDYLIVALGAEYDLEMIPGFQEYAFHVYDLESAIKFQQAVERFEGGIIAIGISRIPFKCPAAPYETALLLDDYYRKKGTRDKISFEFFTPEGTPLPAAGQDIGGKVLEFLRSRGINYHPKLKLTEVGDKELKFETGEAIPYDLLFCVPPHRAPQTVIEAGLTDPNTGWVPVNPRTLETG